MHWNITESMVLGKLLIAKNQSVFLGGKFYLMKLSKKICNVFDT